jgi:hypothetical protein
MLPASWSINIEHETRITNISRYNGNDLHMKKGNESVKKRNLIPIFMRAKKTRFELLIDFSYLKKILEQA